jgi:3-methylcrotonyl-CoA carboxylase beta subunit
MDLAEEEVFLRPTREQYERQGSPYYSTARLWDNGVIARPRDAGRPGAGPLSRLQRPLSRTAGGGVPVLRPNFSRRNYEDTL